MKEVSELTNRERPIMGVIAYADDFIVSSEEGEADKVDLRLTRTNRAIQGKERQDGDTKHSSSRKRLLCWEQKPQKRTQLLQMK